MAADPSCETMAVEVAAPAAPPTSNASTGVETQEQQQQPQQAASAAESDQETSDLRLSYNGQEHTFVGVPQSKVPSHFCTWVTTRGCYHLVTPGAFYGETD